jgi:hypothetical protein
MGPVAALRAAGAGSGPIRRGWRLSFPPDSLVVPFPPRASPNDIIGRQLARDVGIKAE